MRGSLGTWLAAIVAALSLTTRAQADPVADTCMSAAENAQEMRREGKLLESRTGFDQCARATCPAFVRTDCLKWFDQVQQALPSLVFRAVDAEQRDIVDVLVEVDGTPVTQRLDGKPFVLDPGTHGVRFVRGTVSVEQSILVREGEHDRLVTVALGAPAPGATQRGGIPIASWVVGGMGAAAVAVGATLWALGLGERSAMSSGCAQQHDCPSSQVDSSREKLVVGDVAAGVGVVAIGAAVWMAIAGSRPSTTPQVGFGPTVGGASIGVSGRY